MWHIKRYIPEKKIGGKFGEHLGFCLSTIEHISACLFTFWIALILLTIANVIGAKTDRHADSVASVRNYAPWQTETWPTPLPPLMHSATFLLPIVLLNSAL